MPMPQDMLSGLDQEHSEATATHSKVSDVGKMLELTRKEMDSLAALGEAVTSEDVIKGAAGLVAAGGDPKALAAMMAGDPASGTPPMPSDGAQLAAWVKQQDQFVRQKEAQFAQVVQQTRHQQGVTGLQLLAAHHHNEANGGTPASGPSAPPNPLIPAAATA
jgi:hypothetical protein